MVTVDNVVGWPLHIGDALELTAPASTVLPKTVIVRGVPALMYRLVQGEVVK